MTTFSSTGFCPNRPPMFGQKKTLPQVAQPRFAGDESRRDRFAKWAVGDVEPDTSNVYKGDELTPADEKALAEREDDRPAPSGGGGRRGVPPRDLTVIPSRKPKKKKTVTLGQKALLALAAIPIGIGGVVHWWAGGQLDDLKNSKAARIETHMNNAVWPVVERAGDVQKDVENKLLDESLPPEQINFTKEAGLDQVGKSFKGIAYLQAMLELADQSTKYYKPASETAHVDAKKLTFTETLNTQTMKPVFADVEDTDKWDPRLGSGFFICETRPTNPITWVVDKVKVAVCKDHAHKYVGTVSEQNITTANGIYGTAYEIYNKVLLRAARDDQGNIIQQDGQAVVQDKRKDMDALADKFLSNKGNREDFENNFAEVMALLTSTLADAQPGSPVPENKRSTVLLEDYVGKFQMDYKNMQKDRAYWTKMQGYGDFGLVAGGLIAGLAAALILNSLVQRGKLNRNAKGQYSLPSSRSNDIARRGD